MFCLCVDAVNFWYDMAYDIRYCYYKFVESLIKPRQPSSPASSCDDDDDSAAAAAAADDDDDDDDDDDVASCGSINCFCFNIDFCVCS